MECIKFTLKGRTGFLKQPIMNNGIFMTFGNIHKPAALGILGAILGLAGYSELNIKKGFLKENIKNPEYYEKLKDIQISVVPNKSYFNKKMEHYNNSVGYANRDGGTLQVSEQWLYNPSWDIYLLKGTIEDKLWEQLKKYITEGLLEYPIYLGSRTHHAEIENPEIIDITLAKEGCSARCISLYRDTESSVSNDDSYSLENERIFYYKEELPIDLDNKNIYITEKLCFTNKKMQVLNNEKFYMYQDKLLYFI